MAEKLRKSYGEGAEVRPYLSGLKEPLLKKPEEYELGAAMWRGHEVVMANLREGAASPKDLPWSDSLQAYIDIDHLSPVDAEILHDAFAARSKLVEANLRFAVSLAKKFRGTGLDLKDLIQEANLGLLEGVSGFDHRKGFKFATYISWWIRQKIVRGIANTSRNIRLPVHANEAFMSIRRAEEHLYHELQREPTILEVSEWLSMPEDKVVNLMSFGTQSLSLDAPAGEEGDAEFGDVIASTNQDPSEGVIAGDVRDALLRALEHLPEREQQVIRLRFGLDDGIYRTLESVGSEFGVTRERIRQIESKAFAKLRSGTHPAGRLALLAAMPDTMDG